MGELDVITVSEAARKHDASRNTIYRALDDGRLSRVEISGTPHVLKDEKWESFEPRSTGFRAIRESREEYDEDESD